MKLLPLTILLSVKGVLWHAVRIPVFQEVDHFTLCFPCIKRENIKESHLVFKGFLNSINVFM